jgi:hypothetical protein
MTMKRWMRALLAASCIALPASAVAAASASAEFGIEPGSFSVSTSVDEAGGHPDVVTYFGINSHLAPGEIDPSVMVPHADGATKDIEVRLPPGLIGNPQATPKCAPTAFPNCPLSTQVGVAELRTDLIPRLTAPVFNIEPAEGKVAQFGFSVLGFITVNINAEVRTDGDYGLTMRIPDTPSAAPLISSRLTFWGVPADASHDAERGMTCTEIFSYDCSGGGNASPVAPRPFMTNAFTCGPQAPARLRLNSWQAKETWHAATATLREVTDCDRAPFRASLSAKPTTTRAGAPTGFAVDIDIPQNDSPSMPGTPPLKRAVVTLPEGMAVSPSGAGGLGACTDAQVGVGSTTEASCPRASIIGSAEIVSPLLDVPLTGSIVLGEPSSSQLLRLWLLVEGGAIRLKLPGTIDADPATGRLTATFDDQPVLASSRISLRFKDGDRAVLSNPATCGVKTTSATLTGYAGAPVSASASYEVSADGNGAPCPAPGFAPVLSAGTTTTKAGAPTAFTLTFARADGEQPLGGVDVTLPRGVMPKIGTVPLCAEALAAAGGCGEESRIGSAQVLAGPGSQPYALPGRVYVAGPYQGAPYSLAIVVPAQAGPLDLGTVVVRAAVHVDLHTAALRIVSDPLPTILKGIPLQLRKVNVTIDRRGFMVNPTNCSRQAVDATIVSAQGATATRSSRFQVGDCAALPFTPKLTVKVGGKGQVGARKATSLVATLTQRAGQAAAASVRLDLPKSLNARLSVVNRACTQAAYDAGRCGVAAKIGSGSAVTSLLRAPLKGDAYFVKNPARSLPDIVVQLRGEVAIDLVGRVRITGTKLTTTFDRIPDVPLSRFTLSLPAANSPVAVTDGLCRAAARKQTASQTMVGQNGKRVVRTPKLAIVGCAKRK